MSILGSIMSRIFTSAEANSGAASAPPAKPAEIPPSTPEAGSPDAATGIVLEVSPTARAVDMAGENQPRIDVEAVLAKMASKNGDGGNWQSSIVDLLKLLDLDSSFDARKELARELSIHIGADGSAEENIALHKAVMLKLGENGGKVPAGLKG
jgi:hypothetical protein